MIHYSKKSTLKAKKGKKMIIWNNWFVLVKELRPAFSRDRTFLWFVVCLAGLSIRSDLFGVTSIVRSIGLKSIYYDRLLDFFHSKAVSPDNLARIWVRIVLKYFPKLVTFNGRFVFVGDGIKIPKSGKKMPGVRLIHQQSESNTKPEYIMGHSFQAAGILCGTQKRVFSVPVISRIHEGVKFTPKDKYTLLDKMIKLLRILKIDSPCYFVADAYYASKNIIKPLLETKWDLITRVRSNAVAYFPATPDMQPKSRGRKRVYGKKVKLKDLLSRKNEMTEIASPVYGEKNVSISYLCIDLLWRPVCRIIRFVIVVHPVRGKIFLMTTDLTLSPSDIIKIYGYRFKIEISFKQILRIIGGYSYHFWMKQMVPTKRNSKNTYIHRKDEKYRSAVKRKINAYHLYTQTAIIAQGLMMYLALYCPHTIWRNFDSWMRTMNVDAAPSEFVTSTAMRNTFPEFLMDWRSNPILKKFFLKRMDFSSVEESDLAA